MSDRLFLSLVALALTALGSVVVVGSSFLPTAPSGAGLSIAASFYPMAYFTEQITGNLATVTTITPLSVEPHDYEPSASDMIALEKAQLVVLNGGVEAWAADVQANLDTKVVTAGEGLLIRNLQGTTDVDPHVWLDPLLAEQEVTKIADAVAQVDPAHAATYHQNAQDLKDHLTQLDTDYRAGLRSCQKQDIVTSHAAFGYLAARYGFNQVAITGLSPEAEPSAEQLAKIADYVRSHQVKAIFFESLVSPKLAQTIATETGAQPLELNPLEGLTTADQEQNYFTVMRANLTNLRMALVCQ